MPTICIYASELAVVLGLNKYQNISDIILKLWEKNYPVDYENTVSEIKLKKNIEVVKKESDKDFINRVQGESNLNIKDQLDECLKTTDTKKMLETRDLIMREVSKNASIGDEVKKEFKKTIESMTNKNNGTINEKSIREYYSEKSGKRIIVNEKFIRRDICTYNGVKWAVGGKIDGITEDDIVIEIKNRIYKLFYELRDYEKVQLYTYMFILGLQKGHLVESMKKKNSNEMEINIIEEEFDKEYWNGVILPRLNNFIKLFHLFLESVELKNFILLADEDDKKRVIEEFLCKDL